MLYYSVDSGISIYTVSQRRISVCRITVLAKSGISGQPEAEFHEGSLFILQLNCK